MTHIYSEAEFDRASVASQDIRQAMNAVSDYNLLVGIMSGHIQRMICDRALQGEDPQQLLESFQEACDAKVKWWIAVCSGKSAA